MARQKPNSEDDKMIKNLLDDVLFGDDGELRKEELFNCNDWNKESCGHKYIILGGEVYKRNTTYFDVGKRCHDCGIINRAGYTHHYGCDMEQCPKCRGQLISCDCKVEGILERKPIKK